MLGVVEWLKADFGCPCPETAYEVRETQLIWLKNHCTDPALIAAVLEHLGESAVGVGDDGAVGGAVSLVELWSTGTVTVTGLAKAKRPSKAVAAGGGGGGVTTSLIFK